MGQGPAPNINQVIITGKLSIANYNYNIRNIIQNVQSDQTGMFVGRGEKISKLDLDGVHTGTIYHLYDSLSNQLKKGEPILDTWQ